MDIAPDAQEYLEKLYSCVPRHLHDDLDATHRGIGSILGFLDRADGEVCAGALAADLGVSTARIAALLKKMEHSGLILRLPSSEDGRRTVVRITPEGTASLDALRTRALGKVSALLKEISKEDLDAYIRISQQIKETLETS